MTVIDRAATVAHLTGKPFRTSEGTFIPTNAPIPSLFVALFAPETERNIGVFTDKEAAWQFLHNFVKERWENELFHNPELGPIPPRREDAIQTFLDECTNDWADIYTVPFDPVTVPGAVELPGAVFVPANTVIPVQLIVIFADGQEYCHVTTTEEDVKDFLYGYAVDGWEHYSEVLPSRPTDRDEAIAIYFGHGEYEVLSDEWYSVTPTTVDLSNFGEPA